MGKPKIRLNPQVKSAVSRTLLKQGTLLLLSVAMLFPEPKQPRSKRGPKPYGYRIITVLCILRILLRKSYEDYETEMRGDPRLKEWLGLKQLPSKSTVQRGMQLLTMARIKQFHFLLIRPWLRPRVNALLDASGIRIIGRSIWYCIRTKKRILRRECDKVHLAVCNDTLLVLNWFLTKCRGNDSPFFVRLLAPFRLLGLVIADAAYCARKHFQFVADRNGAAFIDLKKGVTTRAGRCPAWSAAIRLAKAFPSLWKGIYNQRSKVEAVFSALKKRYGDKLYGKSWWMRRREFALRLIAYNVRLILCIRYAQQHKVPLWVRA